MRKNNLLLYVLFVALGFTVFSCKKSSTTTEPMVVPANVFNGSINIYSSGNDTTLQRFLNGKYNTIKGSLILSSSDVIDYKKYFVNLVEVQGSVTLYKIPNKDLSFLSTLRNIVGNFQISSCPELISFNGVAALDTIGSSLIVERNSKLVNFTGLEQILKVSSITVTANPSLVSFSGLQNLTTISGTLGIYQNPVLTSLIGLTGLTSIGGDMNISENPNFVGFTGLDNLLEIKGTLSLTTLPQLNSLANFTPVNDTITSISLVDCNGLSNLLGLGNIPCIKSNLNIVSCKNLENLTGLAKIDTIRGTVISQ
jgi:hypothetical protein